MSEWSHAKLASLQEILRPVKEQEVPESERITVHAAISKFAVLYEKIRNAVDYRDEHLLRKSAIVRILKRQLLLERDPRVIATNVIRELIAARYLPNGVLPESRIDDIAWRVHRHMMVADAWGSKTKQEGDWLLGVTATDIEEALDTSLKSLRLITWLFEAIGDRLTVRGVEISDGARRLQTYIACTRMLTKADDEMISARLARWYLPEWNTVDGFMADPSGLATQLRETRVRLLQDLKHPHAQKFQQAVKPLAITLLLLSEALTEHPDADDHKLLHLVEEVAERRLKITKSKVRRGIIRAIVYLFITKTLLAIAIEAPVELLMYKELQWFTLIINVTFPPVLMFLIGTRIRLPGKENIEKIKQCVQELLSAEGVKPLEVKIPANRTTVAKIGFGLVYFLTYFLSFGCVWYILSSLHFTWVSACIFLFFLSVVSFFAFRLRVAAREYIVVKPKEKFLTVLVDFVSLPVLRAGQFLSTAVSRVNVFVYLFDFVIETPYKLFLNVLEEWFAFMKEKKEEIQ